MTANVERFAAIAGLSSPQWPSGRPVRQAKRDRLLIYSDRACAARIETVTDPTTGKVTRAYNPRTLNIARPSQTRGSSRIPDAQDVAHALGAASAGSLHRQAQPLGVAILWDWITGEYRHPWIPEKVAPQVVPYLFESRRGIKMTAKRRILGRHLASLATIDVYRGLVTRQIVANPPDAIDGDRDAEKLWQRISETSLRLMTDAADAAASAALLVMYGDP